MDFVCERREGREKERMADDVAVVYFPRGINVIRSSSRRPRTEEETVAETAPRARQMLLSPAALFTNPKGIHETLLLAR